MHIQQKDRKRKKGRWGEKPVAQGLRLHRDRPLWIPHIREQVMILGRRHGAQGRLFSSSWGVPGFYLRRWF